ncbi:hypothetical protein AB9P05_18595 [Roseivirga sp. BDSF3-8]|uniref:hypothetical protein n=1 Tax=Roseivirga sp. BDSF3-8 TaxID=3241598 RepID=UPI00353242DC
MKCLLISFVLILFCIGCSEEDSLLPPPAVDETKAYIRLKNETPFQFLSVTAHSSEGDIEFPSLMHFASSHYQAYPVKVAAVTARVKGLENPLSSAPVGYFGAVLAPGLYTCVISVEADPSDGTQLHLEMATDREF